MRVLLRYPRVRPYYHVHVDVYRGSLSPQPDYCDGLSAGYLSQIVPGPGLGNTDHFDRHLGRFHRYESTDFSVS